MRIFFISIIKDKNSIVTKSKLAKCDLGMYGNRLNENSGQCHKVKLQFNAKPR